MNTITVPPERKCGHEYNGKEYTISPAHPAAEAFPWIGEVELQALADDIAANGQKDDIIRLPDGRVVDGRNRELACLIAGVKPRYRTTSINDAQIVAYVMTRNLRRRDLEPGQRAIIAAELAKLLPGSNQHVAKSEEVTARAVTSTESLTCGSVEEVTARAVTSTLTQSQLAEQLNVSVDSIQRANTVISDAPELADLVKSGKLPVKTAANIAKLPRKKRQKVVQAADPKAEAKKQLATVKSTPIANVDGPQQITPPKTSPLPALDAWGIPIQPHATEAFAAVPEYKRLVGLLKEVQQSLTALAEGRGGHHLLRKCQYEKSGNKNGGRWVLNHLDDAIAVIQDATPKHGDCPYAHNPYQTHDESCSLCAGVRYTGNLKANQVPPELVSALQAHYGVPEKEAA